MRIWTACLVLLILGLVAEADAAPTGVGWHFIVAFPDTMRNMPKPSQPLPASASLVIFADQRTRVTISGPGIASTVVIDSSASTTIQLPTDFPIYLDELDAALRRTYDVRADGDIIVYAF